jgi:hypothetical protein
MKKIRFRIRKNIHKYLPPDFNRSSLLQSKCCEEAGEGRFQ